MDAVSYKQAYYISVYAAFTAFLPFQKKGGEVCVIILINIRYTALLRSKL